MFSHFFYLNAYFTEITATFITVAKEDGTHSKRCCDSHVVLQTQGGSFGLRTWVAHQRSYYSTGWMMMMMMFVFDPREAKRVFIFLASGLVPRPTHPRNERVLEALSLKGKPSRSSGQLFASIWCRG
jgi:hypothetical protein